MRASVYSLLYRSVKFSVTTLSHGRVHAELCVKLETRALLVADGDAAHLVLVHDDDADDAGRPEARERNGRGCHVFERHSPNLRRDVDNLVGDGKEGSLQAHGSHGTKDPEHVAEGRVGLVR